MTLEVVSKIHTHFTHTQQSRDENCTMMNI